MSSPPLPERTGLSTQHMNINRELLKLMRPGRIGGNRRCADCDAELTEYGNIWASVEQGCFVCVHCLPVHRSLGFRVKSVNMDLWAAEEVEQMTAMGNVKVNEIYERYVPSSWNKPTPDAEREQREQWIVAKYKHKYFMLPHYREKGVDVVGYQSTNSVSQTLPIRLVDYFVVVGAGGIVLDRGISPMSPPGDVEIREKVLDCFPEADTHLGCPLPEHLSQFVFPDGMRLRTQESPPTMFHFVLTNSCGFKMHGAVLQVTEEIDTCQVGGMVSQALSAAAATAGRAGSGVGPRGSSIGRRRGLSSAASITPARLPPWLSDTMATPERTGGDEQARAQGTRQVQQLYAPKALVLLSHYPFYNLYTQFLQQIYRIGLSEAPLPIERYISNFVCEVPLPPQGQVEVSYALPDRTVTISRPPKNQLPLVDFSYRPLLTCMSVENILCVVGLLLMEAKVALCSSHYALLTPVAEGLVSLLFPFVWQGAYIPVMPFNMRDVLEAPVPFLVGIHSRYLSETSSDQRPQGVVFVDLDNDRVYLGIDEDLGAPRRRPHMPEREASKLRQKLNEFSPTARRARTSHASTEAGASLALTSVSGSGGSLRLGGGLAGMAGIPPVIGSGTLGVTTSGTFSGGGAGAGAGGGGGGSGSSGSDAKGAGGSSPHSLSKVDLAFPNNEHLLPISTFSTEQGLTVPSSYSRPKSSGHMARAPNQRKHMKKFVPMSRSSAGGGGASAVAPMRFGSQGSVSLLDPQNHTNAPDGFSGQEIRAAFLRFFVSIFRGYLAHVVMPTHASPYPEKLFNKEAFLKSCGHLPESSHAFMNALLDSQLFERFLEERTTNPTQPEVRFFDESIAAKLNRSKTNPIKRDTPFLNDVSDAHSQVFTPPAPSNWGLPDDGSQYAYGLSFPRLNKDRYGTVRWAKRLFKTPDQHRNVSSANHQRLLSGVRWGAGAGSGGGSHGTRARTRRKGVEEVAVQRNVSHARPEAAGVIRGLIRLQALYRMHEERGSFRAKKEAASMISRAWSDWEATTEASLPGKWSQELLDSLSKFPDRLKLYTVLCLVKDIQRVFRGHLARRAAAVRLASVLRIQAWARMVLLRRHFLKLKNAAELIQAVARGRNCRLAFLAVRELVMLAQAAVRGFLERRVAARQRNVRVKELRAQVFELWVRASTPLVYRSKFWVLFQGGGFLDLAVHEDEALRLWRDLGLVDHHKEHITRVHFNQTFLFVGEWLRTTRPVTIAAKDQSSCNSSPRSTSGGDGGVAGAAQAPATHSPSSLRSRVFRHSSVAMRKLGNGANLGLTSGVLSTLGLSSLRRSSTAPPPAPTTAAVGVTSPVGAGAGVGSQQTAVALRYAAERVMEERDRLYVELKKETQEGTRVSLFSLFGLEKQRKRKRKLADMLWCDVALADASAEVVLSVFRDHLDSRHAWVENKREARIRADLLCTVQACILSLQRIKDSRPAEESQAIANSTAGVANTISTSLGVGTGAGADGERSRTASLRSVPEVSRIPSWGREEA